MLPSDPLPPEPLPSSAHNPGFNTQFGEGNQLPGEFATELSFWLERLVPKHLSPTKRAIVRQMVTRWVAESNLHQV